MALAWSSDTRFHEGRPAASVKRRGAGDRAQRLETILATLPSGRQERGQDGRDVGTELRAEAAGDPAVDDGGAEILLGGVVGGRDTRAVEEDEQAGAVVPVARLKATGVGGIGPLGQE